MRIEVLEESAASFIKDSSNLLILYPALAFSSPSTAYRSCFSTNCCDDCSSFHSCSSKWTNLLKD